MAGAPKRRGRRGQVVKPWKKDPSLSTRPPFAPGNLAALRHGADSHRMVAPLAAGFERALYDVAPWTRRPVFAEARASLSWTEAQITLLQAYLNEHGLLDGDGRPRPAARRLDRLEARAAKLLRALGLTPRSLPKLLASLQTVACSGGDEHGLAALRAEHDAMLVRVTRTLEVEGES
jgi:hypothetical protein